MIGSMCNKILLSSYQIVDDRHHKMGGLTKENSDKLFGNKVGTP